MCYSHRMAQKGDRRRGKPLNPDLGYAGDPVHHTTSNLPAQRIGIRELRQHASVYVDLVERGYTVDITNRGRLVARHVRGPADRERGARTAARHRRRGRVVIYL